MLGHPALIQKQHIIAKIGNGGQVMGNKDIRQAKAVKLATNFDIKPGEGMWAMMQKMTPEAMAGMISTMPDGFIESLNAKLIKIKK